MGKIETLIELNRLEKENRKSRLEEIKKTRILWGDRRAV